MPASCRARATVWQTRAPRPCPWRTKGPAGASANRGITSSSSASRVVTRDSPRRLSPPGSSTGTGSTPGPSRAAQPWNAETPAPACAKQQGRTGCSPGRGSSSACACTPAGAEGRRPLSTAPRERPERPCAARPGSDGPGTAERAGYGQEIRLRDTPRSDGPARSRCRASHSVPPPVGTAAERAAQRTRPRSAAPIGRVPRPHGVTMPS